MLQSGRSTTRVLKAEGLLTISPYSTIILKFEFYFAKPFEWLVYTTMDRDLDNSPSDEIEEDIWKLEGQD